MNGLTRRQFLGTAAAAGVATAGQGLLPGLAAANTAYQGPIGKAEHCVFIWLGGGMAQIDTFDPKRMGDAAERVPGSYYPAIDTVVPGVNVCEHLKRTAGVLDRMTICRTVNHEVIDEHAAAVNRVHTGRPVSGTVVYPSVGSIISHERGAAGDDVPPYVLIGYPNITRGPGFLGAQYSYVYLTSTETGPSGLARPADLSDRRRARREEALGLMRRDLRQRFDETSRVADYDNALGEALRLGGPDFMGVFDLDSEKGGLRERYGGEFGQRCLLTRRLIERGVRFVEVAHNLNFVNGTGWDTHKKGQLNQHLLIRELDAALSTLVLDLEERRLLDKTLIVVATEFGRPPGFDAVGGRGHQSTAFSMVLAGGGLNHCGAYGESDDLAKEPVSKPVSIPDFHATIHAAMGIDPTKELYDGDRPVPITDRGRPIGALFS
jgi:hypothetical protein